MSNTTNRRLADKLDRLFWFMMWLLPLAVFAFCYAMEGSDLATFLAFLSENFSFTFIEEILDNLIQTTFNSSFAFTPYLSYVVGVEIVHVFFDVIVFIPRLAHKWVSKAVQ